MATRRGRPTLPHPRARGVFVRFSDAEWVALERAKAADHPVSSRSPSMPAWIRDLMVAHAGAVLGVEVTRAALRAVPGGAPDWKRWRLAKAAREAARRRRKRAT